MLNLDVDVDEADVAVLSQHLSRTKELFSSINSSLLTITSKTLTASRSIRPVFAEINALNKKKSSIEEGLVLLEDVSKYSVRAADAQQILASSIDAVGVAKYLLCLELSKALAREMKQKIRDFDGVVIGFANTVDKAEISIVSYFANLLSKIDLRAGVVPSIADAVGILASFAKLANLRTAHETLERSMGLLMTLHLAPLEAACSIQKRSPNAPYERGSSGITGLATEILVCVAGLRAVCDQLNVLGSPVPANIVTGYMELRFCSVLSAYNSQLAAQGLVGQDLVMLDVIDQLDTLNAELHVHKFGFEDSPATSRELQALLAKCQGLFAEWARYVEARVLQIDRLNEHSIPEVVVEVISKVRRISEYGSLFTLMKNKKLGSWLDVKPPLRFIAVYTSVVQGAEAQAKDHAAFLVSSFLLDLIDELMVNIEIGLKEQASETSLRKLSQGFMLVRNVVMIETIVNRLEPLFLKLGPIGMERLQRLKNRFLKVFLDDWSHASYIIIRDMTQITTTNALHGGQNSTKEKEQIKDLFRNFNESFEEALKQYEKFQVQEKELRSYLSSEIKKLIINAYNKLYDKYGTGEFTKNRAKYIKYDKMQFERLLNERL
ncbi:hypothetical protein METBIDRAFT_40181 [Metschnikowia bicuspidata var. bicuspidata NRRL YB-4993]|uniref:Exocyst complex protein EXO70 n=1 Tax=Metschnikowia bicuspidata var. bicuspidata NRRL YB-4993 TaxID=869754 RepID=A0A1A0HD28_9ASCO|nr:hypothetical protein METBIDRAFT_40181 [Metschnikowia bicuspidata var. bicuspidata NRRL YB-4993]OBA21792.1 hypothetical protein METBIDRAFT_40181 [Metschnikowia bicuspidata var. bicuspidata NRRL YB-4993]